MTADIDTRIPAVPEPARKHLRLWAFSGQGSQHKGMGAGLFERFPAEVAQADAVLGYSVARLCLENSGDRLADTRFAQPALFVVNHLSYLARLAEGERADWLAGHSLGELNALCAAGSYSFGTGLQLVRQRGELMAGASGGGLLAVVGAPAARVAEVLAGSGATEVDVANENSPRQVVLAGPLPALDAAAEAIRRQEPQVRCVPLRVAAAFHSRFMTDAASRFAAYLTGFALAAPRLPVLANATGERYPAEGVADLLARQIDSPVRWLACLRHAVGSGVGELVEVGPGRVLGGLWRDTFPDGVGVPAQAATDPVPPLPVRQPSVRARTLPEPAEQGPPGDPATALGRPSFRAAFGTRYAYLAGSMFRGVSSVDLVARLGHSGLAGFFGSGGLSLPAVEAAVSELERRLGRDRPWGVNLLYPLGEPDFERASVELLLRREVRFVEAAGYSQITPELVRLRYTGARRDSGGQPVAARRIVAKVSRPETARAFMSPAPEHLIRQLRDRGDLSAPEAELAAVLPISHDICVESDSAGHTDAGVALALVPSLRRLRDEIAARQAYPEPIHLGAAGGLGTPTAVAAAFVLGADFVLTGSVNQCTPQAGTSEPVKDLLASLDVQDTTYAPAGDMFELGARVQVVRKGTLFAARANKLYQLYRTYAGLEELPPAVVRNLESRIFRQSLEQVWRQTEEHHLSSGNEGELQRARRDPRHRMALTFRWYFAHSTAAALQGFAEDAVDYQVHCGPAMGAFNRFVAGTALEDWRRRDPEAIAELLMRGAAAELRNCSVLS